MRANPSPGLAVFGAGYAFTSFSVPHSGHSMNTPNSCPSLTPSASVFEQLPQSSRSGPSPLKAIFPFGGAWMIALARGASSTTVNFLSAMGATYPTGTLDYKLASTYA
jgi:hypothetical protein